MFEAVFDWLWLLGGPDKKTFAQPKAFPRPEDWTRLVRLMSMVLALAAAATGGVVLSGNVAVSVAVTESSTLLLALLVGAAIAVPYTYLAAAAFGVPLTVPQVVFSFLLVALPWLPLVILAKAIIPIALAPFMVFAIYFTGAMIAMNFAKAVCLLVPRCPRWRVWGSVISTVGVSLTVWILWAANVVRFLPARN